ncbi:hypothetical protein CRX72_18030 [Pantoea sp. BRM17]|nr:hypothetical protein CRX72_18030 [Pantoea sp. BRM17]
MGATAHRDHFRRHDAILGTGIGYGLRKGDSQLKTALDEAISKVQADGTVTRLAAKYFPGIDVTASKQP